MDALNETIHNLVTSPLGPQLLMLARKGKKRAARTLLAIFVASFPDLNTPAFADTFLTRGHAGHAPHLVQGMGAICEIWTGQWKPLSVDRDQNGTR
jgi:hypothetical protein